MSYTNTDITDLTDNSLSVLSVFKNKELTDNSLFVLSVFEKDKSLIVL